MRGYRARKRPDRDPVVLLNGATYDHLQTRIVELEAEVARLQRELAARPSTFNTRPFTPVPKSGRRA